MSESVVMSEAKKKPLIGRSLKNILFFLDVIQFSIVNIFLVFYYLVKKIFPSKKKIIRGQLALITGGGNGLGRSISFALAESGCNIIILDIDANMAEQTASDIRNKHNVKVSVFMVDVSKFHEVQHVRKLIEKEIGEVDILVNNAGILPFVSILEGAPSDIEKIISVNLTSSFWMIREFIKTMYKRNSGHIVTISSLSAFDALGRQAAYSATKYGLRGLMESLQEELRIDKSEIVATAVFPNFIKTRPYLVEYMDKSLKDPSSMVYLSPEETASAVVNAIVTNKLNVTVPSYYEFLISVSGLFPKEVMNRWRDKFKPILYTNCNIEPSI